MIWVETFSQHTWLFQVTVFIFGLMVGSFLNVVIHRLPKMMMTDWRHQCAEFYPELEQPAQSEAYNLVKPASHCPACGHTIRAWENIPVLSYLLQKGRCRACQASISVRYPLVELATAGLFLWAALEFGVSWQSAAVMLLAAMLLAASLIDYDHQLLPDNMTLPLLWLGLLLNTQGMFVSLSDSVIGAAAGYLSLWTLYQIHHRLTGKHGMGHGDFKLLAVFGAWLGWQALPVVILLSSLVGAVLGIALILMRGRDKDLPIPFGPFIAAAGWLALFYGDVIIDRYLKISGLGV